jgi:DNA-binding NarL/FixJ family response regulator
MKVLVVEDEALIAFNLEGLLEELGYTVIGPVASAHQAYQQISTNPPELAVIDLNLTDGRTGLELAHHLASVSRTVVVVATANPEDAKVGDLVFAILRKPYTDRALEDTMRRAAIHASKRQSAAQLTD